MKPRLLLDGDKLLEAMRDKLASFAMTGYRRMPAPMLAQVEEIQGWIQLIESSAFDAPTAAAWNGECGIAACGKRKGRCELAEPCEEHVPIKPVASCETCDWYHGKYTIAGLTSKWPCGTCRKDNYKPKEDGR